MTSARITRGSVTFWIDQEDIDIINSYPIYKNEYVVAKCGGGLGTRPVHRLIADKHGLDLVSRGIYISGDRLDLRKSNLRTRPPRYRGWVPTGIGGISVRILSSGKTAYCVRDGSKHLGTYSRMKYALTVLKVAWMESQ